MNQSASTDPNIPKKTDWLSIVQLCLYGLAVIGFWSMSLLKILQLLFPRNNQISEPDIYAYTVSIAGWFFLGVVLLFCMILTGARLFGSQTRLEKFVLSFKKALHPKRLFWLVPVLLLVGYAVSSSSFTPLLMPPIHIITTCLFVSLLLWLGIRYLPKGSFRREMGVFTTGMAFAPFITTILEISSLLCIVFAVVFLIMHDPTKISQLERIAMQLQYSQASPERMRIVIGEVINNDKIISLAIFYLAVIIPVIEELLKPIGVWLLSGRELTQADGLVIGMVSGAGFTLFETIAAVPGNIEWVWVIPLRMATSAMHIATAGLVGWALVNAVKQRRFARLLAAYILAVLDHGIWNMSAGLFSYASFLHQLPPLRNPLVLPDHIVIITAILFVFLATGNLILLVKMNKWMRGQVVVEYAADLQLENES